MNRSRRHPEPPTDGIVSHTTGPQSPRLWPTEYLRLPPSKPHAIEGVMRVMTLVAKRYQTADISKPIISARFLPTLTIQMMNIEPPTWTVPFLFA
jgi:hypothetical protein